jgi:hypothetical protein
MQQGGQCKDNEDYNNATALTTVMRGRQRQHNVGDDNITTLMINTTCQPWHSRREICVTTTAKIWQHRQSHQGRGDLREERTATTTATTRKKKRQSDNIDSDDDTNPSMN